MDIKEKILLIEDEKNLTSFITTILSYHAYEIIHAGSGYMGVHMAASHAPDLILLDLMLPGTDGFAFCRSLRSNPRTAKIPVIMVTARDEDADIVAGLEVGADDYITKPFSSRILTARVRTVLRRHASGQEEGAHDFFKRGPFEIDRTCHAITLDGKPLTLTLSEFKALELFLRRPGIVFSRYQIVDVVHGEDYAVTDRSVDVLLVGLRKKLGKYSDIIETVRGVGYRMKT